MMQEYYEWIKRHPDATEEEQQEMWDKCMRMLEARCLLFDMLISYRFL